MRILVILGGCTGRSESLLITQVLLLALSCFLIVLDLTTCDVNPCGSFCVIGFVVHWLFC